MNEGENSSMPNSTNFSSPNISPSDNQTPVDTATPTQQDVTSSDISAMAGTDAGVVAAAAAAMPESDGRQAISSTPSASAPSTSRARLGFSNRRFNQAAAQQSAPSFAGAPDYFNQAVSDLPVDNSSQGNKKKAIALVGLVIAIVVVAVIAIVVVPMLVKPYPDGMTADTVREQISEDTVASIGKLEDFMYELSNKAMYADSSLSPRKDEKLISGLKETLAAYKNTYETISKYEAVQYRADTAEFFANAKNNMSKMVPIYERVADRYEKVYSVIYDNADISTISSLPGYSAQVATDLKSFSSMLIKNNKYKSMNCTVEQRTTVGTTCYELRQELMKMESSKGNTVDLRTIIVGDDADMLKNRDYSSKDYVLSILYAVDNKKVAK